MSLNTIFKMALGIAIFSGTQNLFCSRQSDDIIEFLPDYIIVKVWSEGRHLSYESVDRERLVKAFKKFSSKQESKDGFFDLNVVIKYINDSENRFVDQKIRDLLARHKGILNSIKSKYRRVLRVRSIKEQGYLLDLWNGSLEILSPKKSKKRSRRVGKNNGSGVVAGQALDRSVISSSSNGPASEAYAQTNEPASFISGSDYSEVGPLNKPSNASRASSVKAGKVSNLSKGSRLPWRPSGVTGKQLFGSPAYQRPTDYPVAALRSRSGQS